MITISEPRDKLTCNMIEGLRTLINSKDANTVNRLSYPCTVEVTLVERELIFKNISTLNTWVG